MTADEVNSFVEAQLPRLKTILGLADWRIRFTYEACGNDGAFGECSVSEDTHTADITIDPDLHPDVRELADTLLHELSHVVLAPFEVLAETALMSAVDSDRLHSALERVHNYSREAGVRNVLRILKHCGLLSTYLTPEGQQ